MEVPKKFLNKFKYIEEECTAEVTCMATVDETFLHGKEGSKRYFIPLRVLDANRLDELMDILDDVEGDYIDMEELYPFTLSGTIWESSLLDTINLPIKGEKVLATFEYDENEDLRCVGIVPLAKVKPKSFNLDKFNYNRKYNE